MVLRARKPHNDSYLWRNAEAVLEKQPAHIGEMIKRHRFKLKMTAVRCREILGVDRGTLRDWECGRHTPGRENLRRIVEFLGYDPFVDEAKA